MKRREILRYTALVTGAAVCAPVMGTLISGCKPEQVAQNVESGLSFFTQDEFKLVKEVIDVILPKSDSPSATEVGVHNIIDAMVGTVYPKDNKTSYRSGFNAFAQYINSSKDKLESLKLLEHPVNNDLKDVKEAYLHLKQQTVAYYLSTEEIGTNFLNYLPVPGIYESCIDLSEVDNKAWAI